MNNKQLGIGIIIFGLLLILILISLQIKLEKSQNISCSCVGQCPMEKENPWLTYTGIILIALMIGLGIYLIFFEKSQKAIVSTLEKQKQIQTEEEKFNILLKGLNQDEQKVIKAVKEQDGITQQTLRLRTDMHKSKLSILLDGLEKKGLIARKEKGKTKQVFLKIHI